MDVNKTEWALINLYVYYFVIVCAMFMYNGYTRGAGNTNNCRMYE